MAFGSIWRDDFVGPGLDSRWSGGHLNASPEVRLVVRDGLRFTFDEGSQYASAGVVTHETFGGDFEAEVAFEVTHPAAGSTFELAAITVAPPAETQLPGTHFDDAQRVFNVHGSPPYVSSEFDEDDGWRIGFNNGNRQGRRGADGSWIADNTDNRYGHSILPQSARPATGWLRLARRDGRWQAQGSVDGNDWFLSGEGDAQLAGAVHLRLVAKHWVKHREGRTVAPANSIVLSRFTVRF